MPVNSTVLYMLRPAKKVDVMLSDLGTIKKYGGWILHLFLRKLKINSLVRGEQLTL